MHSELVQPGQLPDGLIEAQLTGEPSPDLYLVEVGTYPEQRLVDQLSRGTALVFLDRREIPEVLAIVLRPKGTFQLPSHLQVESRRGLAAMEIRWTVVELWKVPAEELLRFQDPGLVPWIPLADDGGNPEPVLHRCREIIERAALPGERENLLAVAQVLSGLRYNEARIFEILGGPSMILESPLIQQMLADAEARGETKASLETKHHDILRILRIRHGAIPELVELSIRMVSDEHRLEALLDAAVRCESIDEFRSHLD